HVSLERIEHRLPVRHGRVRASLVPERLLGLRVTTAEENEHSVVACPERLCLSRPPPRAMPEELDEPTRRRGERRPVGRRAGEFWCGVLHGGETVADIAPQGTRNRWRYLHDRRKITFIATRKMHQTTVRFGEDLWEALENECARLGVSVAQY